MILSITVGVAALGMVIGTYSVILNDLPAQFKKVIPAHAQFFISPFDDELVRVIESLPGVEAAEGRYSFDVRVKVGDEWRKLQLTVIQDFNQIKINRLFPFTGNWPPSERQIILERTSLPLIESDVGDRITVQTPEGIERELEVAGLAHDLKNPASNFTGQTNGFLDFATLEWLGYPREFNQLLVTVEGENLDYFDVRGLSYVIEEKITKGGRTVFSTIIPPPDEHWLIPYITPMALLLMVIGFIILSISGLLIINTISALLAQQKRQIGIMKAIGARSGQITGMYIFSMVVIGLISFGLAVPLGREGTKLLVNFLAGWINFDIAEYVYPTGIYWFQLVLCVFLPVFVAMFPIRNASKITVLDAINDIGLANNQYGENWFDRFISSIRILSRPLMLSVRNTFRKRSRLVITLLMLSSASAIFMSVLSVYSSLGKTLDDVMNYYEFDIALFFSREYRSDQLLSELSRLPYLDNAETWGIANARVINEDDSETNNILFVSPPTDTTLIQPSVLKGRWLLPEDENAVVINTDVLREKPGLDVGDVITLKIDGGESAWKIVGITRSVMTGPWIYANYPYFARRLGRYGVSSGVYISLKDHSVQSQYENGKLLEEHFSDAGYNISSINRVYEMRALATNQFRVIVGFLLGMAILLASVGGMGLAGTMSLNILDRTREIGVMRAIGASNRTLYSIVLYEGILIGILSWIIGLVISIPVSKLLSNAVGAGFLRAPLTLIYSVNGSFLWLVLLLIISILASSWAARSAIKLPVREILAYE